MTRGTAVARGALADPPEEDGLVVHPVLGHARGGAKRFHGAQVRRELADLGVELTDERVELLGARLGDWILIVVRVVVMIGHVHLPASGGGTLRSAE